MDLFCKIVKPNPTLVLHVLCFNIQKRGKKRKEKKEKQKEKKKERKKDIQKEKENTERTHLVCTCCALA